MSSAVVKFEDLLRALEFVSAGHPMEHEAYLCRETGVIHYHSEMGDDEEAVPEDIEDAEKYVALPHKNDLDLGRRLALRFVDDRLPEVADDVRDIFRRKGAYARFKNLLEHRGVLQQWYEFEEKSMQQALRQWCEDNEIEVHG